MGFFHLQEKVAASQVSVQDSFKVVLGQHREELAREVQRQEGESKVEEKQEQFAQAVARGQQMDEILGRTQVMFSQGIQEKGVLVKRLKEGRD